MSFWTKPEVQARLQDTRNQNPGQSRVIWVKPESLKPATSPDKQTQPTDKPPQASQAPSPSSTTWKKPDPVKPATVPDTQSQPTPKPPQQPQTSSQSSTTWKKPVTSEEPKTNFKDKVAMLAAAGPAKPRAVSHVGANDDVQRVRAGYASMKRSDTEVATTFQQKVEKYSRGGAMNAYNYEAAANQRRANQSRGFESESRTEYATKGYITRAARPGIRRPQGLEQAVAAAAAKKVTGQTEEATPSPNPAMETKEESKPETETKEESGNHE